LKLLVDSALSPLIASGLKSAGHEAVHVRDYAMQSATDDEIFERAAREQRILLSEDTDFANILALRNQTHPSVILLRRGPRKPSDQLALILANLPTLEDALREGCVAVIESDRIRVRRLPISGVR
jgi:predicted nuclease of predicted toxin-antitoxin system